MHIYHSLRPSENDSYNYAAINSLDANIYTWHVTLVVLHIVLYHKLGCGLTASNPGHETSLDRSH